MTECDKIVVEEHGARFERVHHRGAIHLHEDVFLQIEIRVELERTIDQVESLSAPDSQISMASE